MEYIDVVNENNILTGKSVLKNEVHEKGFWYREVIGFVMNENNEILLQKRAANKKDKANMWEVCYGHVSSKEVPETSMLRELEEEIGLKVEEKDLNFLRIEKIKEQNEDATRFHYAFSYIYLIITNNKISDYLLDKNEVSDIKYVTIKELKQLYVTKDKELALNNLQYLLELLNQIESIYNDRKEL